MVTQGLTMGIEPYEFQNIYLITTYRCNWSCDFCLFHFNREIEAPLVDVIDRLKYSIEDSSRKVYIKITGGEPFLRPDLLQRVFEVAAIYRSKVYKIGIGTNGSFPLPAFFNDVDVKTHIFLSRHDVEDGLPAPRDLLGNIRNSLIDFRLNCNLIKGRVDSLAKIKRYIDARQSQGITHFCFRELSRVNIDANSMYPPQIYDYVEYYKDHLVPYSDIRMELVQDGDFRESRRTGNYYDANFWYWYNYGARKLSVKFRAIDEARLIEFNTEIEPDGVDEYVIHPDGTLTGCWDKELKLITKGGDEDAEQTIYCKAETKEEKMNM